MSVAELLAKTELFSSLDLPTRELVGSRMHPVSFTAGQTIFTRGDAGREVYLVRTGRVRLSILTVEGRELSLAHAVAGNIFGEIAVLDGATRSADATAISAVTAMSLSQSALLTLMDKTPSIARAAIKFLCHRLRETDHKIEAIALHPIEVRLARLLLSAVKFQAPNVKGPSASLELGMSQNELALLIGATRPKVNLALTQFEESGAITRDGTRVVCDLEALNAIAGND